jgi:hypothetical protein
MQGEQKGIEDIQNPGAVKEKAIEAHKLLGKNMD